MMAEKLSLSEEGSGEGVAVSAALTNDESQLRLQLIFNTTSLLQRETPDHVISCDTHLLNIIHVYIYMYDCYCLSGTM